METKNAIGYLTPLWSKKPEPEFFKEDRTKLIAWFVDDCNDMTTHRSGLILA